MSDVNPYASSAPTEDGVSKKAVVVPETLGEVLRQGAKLGFKWGHWTGLAIGATVLILFMVLAVLSWTGGRRLPRDMRSSTDWILMVLRTLGVYLSCCFVTTSTGSLASVAVHLVRKGIRAIRRA